IAVSVAQASFTRRPFTPMSPSLSWTWTWTWTMRSLTIAPVRRSSERLFYLLMSVAILATVFLGFAPSFYLRGSAHPPLPPILILYGVVFSAWILLFVVQTALVSLHRTPVHRRLGVAGGVLAAAMILLGTFVALRSGISADRGRLAFLAVPLFDMPVFAIL